MTILAVASTKGGVGKTTVSLNLACSMARRGWSTLVVDADPQGGVGFSVQGASRRGLGLAACLSGKARLADAVLPTNLPSLHLLPVVGSDAGLDPSDELLGLLSHRERLAEVLGMAASAYDLVIVDTPSGVHEPTASILECSDFVLVPLQAEPLALRTVPQMLARVAALRERGIDLRVAGIVITMVNSKSEISLSVAHESWSLMPPDLVLNGFVPRDAAFQRASAHGVPLAMLSRRPPPVAMVFDQLAAEMEERLNLMVEGSADAPAHLLD